MTRRRHRSPRRPTPVVGAVASLGLHAAAAGVVLALEAWLLDVVEPPEFRGKRNVVQLELALSVAQPAAPLAIVEAPADVSPAEENPPDPPPRSDVLDSPEPVLRADRAAPLAWREPVLEIALRAENEASPPESFSEDVPPPAPLRRRSTDRESMETVEPKREPPLPRKEASLPSLPQVAVPQVAGTDDQTPPDLSGNRKPAYPAAAHRQGLEGEVLLRVWINASGRVQRVEVERSSGHAILDQAAVTAVRAWRGHPARRAGQAVATVELLPIRFVLRQ